MDTFSRRQFLGKIALPLVAFAGCGGGSASSQPESTVRTAKWPEAEALFHKEPKWLGGDGVYSVDLGQGRVLWMFGDSFVATSPANIRSQATIVRNSIAIQTGYDPATASMSFYWSNTDARPKPFFLDANSPKWYWPGHGVRIGNTLLIFFSETQSSTEGLGFVGVGWKAAMVTNPDAAPTEWNVTYLNSPNRFSLVVGASVLVAGDYLYAYSNSFAENGATHHIYLGRFPLAEAAKGNLANLQWYNGNNGWVLQSSLTQAPKPLMGDGQTEFNIYPNLPHTPYLEVQTVGFGASTLAYRTAEILTGNWSGPQQFYSPPEINQPNIMIYSAKMHPMLTNSGADFVASYSTNSTNFNTLVQDASLYYPRFVKANWP